MTFFRAPYLSWDTLPYLYWLYLSRVPCHFPILAEFSIENICSLKPWKRFKLYPVVNLNIKLFYNRNVLIYTSPYKWQMSGLALSSVHLHCLRGPWQQEFSMSLPPKTFLLSNNFADFGVPLMTPKLFSVCDTSIVSHLIFWQCQFWF